MSLRPTLQQVLEGLRREGHIDALAEAHARFALEVHQRTSTASPWFVNAFAAFGAWLSALFALGFFLCVGLWENEVAFVGVGFVFIIVAVALRRAVWRGVFLEQLVLALTLAGGVMVTTGIGNHGSDEAAAGGLLVVSLAVLVACPDAVPRFLATLSAAGAGLFLAWEGLDGLGLDVGILACAALLHVLFLQQARLGTSRHSALVGPVAFGLACGLPGVLLARGAPLLFGPSSFASGPLPMPLLTVGLTALTLYTAWHAMRELGLNPSGARGAAVFAALTLVAIITAHTPSVIAAVGLLVLGFHRRSSPLVELAAAFLLASGAWYYYDLRVTLLAKALTLAASGLVLLALRLLLTRRFARAPSTVEAR